MRDRRNLVSEQWLTNYLAHHQNEKLQVYVNKMEVKKQEEMINRLRIERKEFDRNCDPVFIATQNKKKEKSQVNNKRELYICI